MKAFRRVFGYIFPQWHLLVVILITALIIAVLFSLSLITIIPVLKVMMGQEGLHGWVDRQVCKMRYGLEFYVPDTVAVATEDDIPAIHNLLITKVKDGGIADKAGL